MILKICSDFFILVMQANPVHIKSTCLHLKQSQKSEKEAEGNVEGFVIHSKVSPFLAVHTDTQLNRCQRFLKFSI